MYFRLRCEICVSHTGNEIIIRYTHSRDWRRKPGIVFGFLSLSFFHAFPRTQYTTSIPDIDEETDICQTRNLPKKERKKKNTRKPIVLCIAPLEERRAGPSNRGIPKWAVIDLQSTCRLFSRSRSQQSLNGQLGRNYEYQDAPSR